MSQSDSRAEHLAEEIPATDRLDSWKEIAAFLQRDVRTVQRWEKQAALPVHRHAETRLRTAYAYRSELDAWWRAQRAVVDAGGEAEHDAHTTPTPGSNRTRAVTAAIAGIGLLTVALAVIVSSRGWDRAATADAPPITVLLAHLEDQTGDPRLVTLLEERIARSLQSRRGIEPAAPSRVARMLRLMRQDPAVRPTDAIGREVALRDGRIAFTIGGRIHRLDSGVFVDLAVSDPDGRIRLSRQWHGPTEDEIVLRAPHEVDSLADRLVASGPRAGPAGPPLEQVTTASLPALRLYSAAVDAARRRQWEASELLARRAIAADDRFASAYAWAAWSMRQQGRRVTESNPPLDRALSLAADVSDRESYMISGLSHTIAGDHRRAAAAFEALLRIQPDNRAALDLLIDAYAQSSRLKEATDLAVTRAERDPDDFYASVRAAHALVVTCHDEARGRRFVRRAQELASTPGARDHPFWAAWLAGLPAYQHWLAGERHAALEALTALERSLGERIGRERDAYASTVGFGYLALGRLEQAERAFWQAAAPTRQLDLAMLALTLGDERGARAWLSQIRQHAGMRPALFARAGLDQEAERGLETSTSLEQLEGMAAVTRGLMAMHRGQPEVARAALRRGFDLLRASGEPEYFYAAEALARLARARGETNRTIGYLSHAGATRARTYGPSQWTGGYWIRLTMDLADAYRDAGRGQDAEQLRDTVRQLLDNGEGSFAAARSAVWKSHQIR